MLLVPSAGDRSDACQRIRRRGRRRAIWRRQCVQGNDLPELTADACHVTLRTVGRNLNPATIRRCGALEPSPLKERPTGASRSSPGRRHTRRAVLSGQEGRLHRLSVAFLATTQIAVPRDGTSSTGRHVRVSAHGHPFACAIPSEDEGAPYLVHAWPSSKWLRLLSGGVAHLKPDRIPLEWSCRPGDQQSSLDAHVPRSADLGGSERV